MLADYRPSPGPLILANVVVFLLQLVAGESPACPVRPLAGRQRRCSSRGSCSPTAFCTRLSRTSSSTCSRCTCSAARWRRSGERVASCIYYLVCVLTAAATELAVQKATDGRAGARCVGRRVWSAAGVRLVFPEATPDAAVSDPDPDARVAVRDALRADRARPGGDRRCSRGSRTSPTWAGCWAAPWRFCTGGRGVALRL